ncbi:MAG: DUF2087 domain-containing protein [Geodermatophilaceae bacterium]|nr:DUF2087 domain-containing protein [Geodermatophilaceae bacterium]
MQAGALVGLLAEPDRLRVVAALTLGATTFGDLVRVSTLPAPVVAKAVRRLEAAGLVSTVDGQYELRAELFKEAAREAAPEPDDFGVIDPAEVAVLRSFFRAGRLTHFPTAQAKNGRWKMNVVLRHIVTTFEPGVRYPERDVNAILAAFHPDYAALRRYLVDEGLLSRDAGVYWRTGGWVDVL